ncbi:E3 ubiquitin-protein ligase MARCHF2-like [Prorops nasuta]|uniref:E3 ubiquitin-protein ligase MARCHF2-like n=1 Tax=Prorops nasuta TaxID=863751 RepID=UPI0034D00995
MESCKNEFSSSLEDPRVPLCRANLNPDRLKALSVLCRICHEDGHLEELIEPCECAGTLGLIHCSCLEKWLSTSNTDRCEICKYNYLIQKRDKPLTESFCQWWKSESDYRPQGIAGDILCLIILSPMCAAAIYLCAIGAAAYIKLGFWEGTGLAILCFMLFVTYLLWVFVTVRFHYKSWKQWSKRHQDVKLLLKHRSNNLIRVRSEIGSCKNCNRNENRQRSGSFASWVITSDSNYDVRFARHPATIV